MKIGPRIGGLDRVFLTLDERRALRALVSRMGWRDTPKTIGIGQQTMQSAMDGEHISSRTRERIRAVLEQEQRDRELLAGAEVTT